MSHVTVVNKLYISDLDALSAACDSLGLELQRGKETWAWWGTDQRDSNLSGAHDRSKFGKGKHAIKVKGTNPHNGSYGPWEIGVVERADGQPGYELLFDGYGQAGAALQGVAGKGLVDLKKSYATEVSKRHLARLGYRTMVKKNARGVVQIVGEK